MRDRFDYREASPVAYEAMLALEQFARTRCGIEPGLIELVKLRASQINGCTFCIDMHTHEARQKGETDERLSALPAWRQASLFTARERAALAWSEAVTRIADGPVPDEIFDDAMRHFSRTALVNLTVVCNTINGWNRLAVAFHAQSPSAAPSR